jgi:hypothetical protein
MADAHWESWQQVIGGEDIDALEVLGTAAMYERYFQAVQGQAARLARAQGRSWQEIADAVGATKQTAWKKWGGPREPVAPDRFGDLPAAALTEGVLRPFDPMIAQVVGSLCPADDPRRPELLEAGRRALADALEHFGPSGGKAPFPVYASWWIRQAVTKRRRELRAD